MLRSLKPRKLFRRRPAEHSAEIRLLCVELSTDISACDSVR
jgi:hypothetical protein